MQESAKNPSGRGEDPVEGRPGSAPEFYSLQEVAHVIRVSPDTVRRMLQTGDMDFVRAGRRGIRIHKDALAAWRRAQEGQKYA